MKSETVGTIFTATCFLTVFTTTYPRPGTARFELANLRVEILAHHHNGKLP